MIASSTRGSFSDDELLDALSSPFPAERATEAAEFVIAFDASHGTVRRLYRSLQKHGILPQALDHMVASGADLERMGIPFDLYRRSQPLPRILGYPARDPSGGISLAWIDRRMEEHTALLGDLIVRLSDSAGERRFVVLGGQGLGLACPAYKRWSHDIDLAVADMDRGFAVLEPLVRSLGFRVAGCTLDERGTSPSAIVRLATDVKGHDLHASVYIDWRGGLPEATPLDGPTREATNVRVERLDGREVLTSASDEMLLRVLTRTAREGSVTYLRRNDARILLTNRAGPLDWDRVVSRVRAAGLLGVLGHLADRVETIEGRPLVPADVRDALAPSWSARGSIRRLAVTDPSSPGGSRLHGARRAWRSQPGRHLARMVLDVKRSVSHEGIVGLARRASEGLQWRIFFLQVDAHRRTQGVGLFLSSIRSLRPMVYSLCELAIAGDRDRSVHTGCLSRTERERPPLADLNDEARERLDRITSLVFSEGPPPGHRCADLRWLPHRGHPTRSSPPRRPIGRA